MRKITLTTLIICLIITNHHVNTITQNSPVNNYPSDPVQSQIITDEAWNQIYLDSNTTSLILKTEVIPSFSEFKTVTFVELFIPKNLHISSQLSESRINVKLNGIQTNNTKLKSGSILLLIDEQGKLFFTSPIKIELNITDSFLPKFLLFRDPYHNFTIDYMQIISAERQEAPLDTEYTLSMFSIPDIIRSRDKGGFGGTQTQIFPATALGYLILPRNINTTHYLNLTIRSNILIKYDKVRVGYTQPENDTNFETTKLDLIFRINEEIPFEVSVSQITIDYFAKTDYDYGAPPDLLVEDRLPQDGILFQLKGKWYTKEALHQKSIEELDLYLFMISTAMPILFLVKLLKIRSPKWKRENKS